MFRNEYFQVWSQVLFVMCLVIYSMPMLRYTHKHFLILIFVEFIWVSEKLKMSNCLVKTIKTTWFYCLLSVSVVFVTIFI